MNWYIGQEVVCVKTHIQHKFKEGDVVRIYGLRLSRCSCNYVLINIGIKAYSDTNRCGVCWKVESNLDGVHWFNENHFAPLMDITELKEILNEETINK